MKSKLSSLCSYRKGKIAVSELDSTNYISTENMLADKGGITKSSGLPASDFTQAYYKNDVLVSNIRPYFKKIWFANMNGGCSNDVLVFTANNECEPSFLYYVLSNDDFFNYATVTAKGTKMPRGDKKTIMEYEVPIYDIDTQKKIASILSALDDKIEVNQKINENLEQQAQAIFKSWFVDFEPFKDGEFVNSELGQIPKGWKVGKLSELISIKYGKDHKKLKDGKYPVFGSGGIMRYVERFLYDKESVLIPRKGTLNNVIYVNTPFWSVDTMFYTEMLFPNIAKFIYHFVSGKDLKSMNAGSAVPSMTTDILNNMELVIPTSENLKMFEEIVSPMYRQMQLNNEQSERLKNIRDILLPKLMNGDIDVGGFEL